ncbi:uncharacterized protein LOC119368192 [Triticum dicoccoides]|uniref:uncharacterized protein LOC119368192 n=1 Tax=Triticum dicoccoides TaxID=85692 RepID=UPI001890385C|nr:uncharacterized protein LOC119368192 [Triticum dicoccoides]
MEWVAEQQDLGGLGLAGICREVARVLCATIFNSCLGLLMLLSLILPCANHVLSSCVDSNQGSLLRLAAYWAALLLFKLLYFVLCYALTLFCTCAYVFLVASLYCTGGDFAAANRGLHALPLDPGRRLHRTFFFLAIPLLITFYAGAQAWIALQHLDAPRGVILPLQLMGGAACLAGAGYVTVVCQLACVVSLLEDPRLLAAVRRSRALLAGKFWPAAAIFLTLDACIVALLMAYTPLVVVMDDALGLGIAFPLAAGFGMTVALWAALVVTLVAQPVVYLVCKNHHHEIVDKVHLNYVGDYERLAVDGDNAGVELQPAPQVTTTA